MNKKLMNDIKFCLNNENGAAYIEWIVIVAISLSVGVGLFLFGRHENNTFKREKKVIDENIGKGANIEDMFNWG